MEPSSRDLVEKVRRAGEAIDAWPVGEDLQRRAEAVAALLHSLWPRAALAACVLRGPPVVAWSGDHATTSTPVVAWSPDHATTSMSVLDETGGRRPEWEPSIRNEGLRLGAERASTLPALKLPGRTLAWEDVRFRDRIHGALALAVPEGAPPPGPLPAGGGGEGWGTARDFLAVVGRLLAGRLEVEALERERGAAAQLADEAAGNAWLADVGEAAAPVAHEFNNFLNALLLHVAVLQIKLPPENRAGLEEVRRQAMDVAALIQQFQNYRRRAPAPQGPTDLNRAVRAAALQLWRGLETTPKPAVRLDLAEGELPIIGPYGDLKRLCLLLLRNAVGAAGVNGGGGVVARTARSDGRVVLRVEDGGPPLSPEAAARLFEPSGPARDGMNSLEMAVCRTLARRTQAAVRGEPRPEGGAAVVVEWVIRP